MQPRDCLEARRCRCAPGDAARGAYRTDCVRHRLAAAREEAAFWRMFDRAARDIVKRFDLVGLS